MEPVFLVIAPGCRVNLTHVTQILETAEELFLRLSGEHVKVDPALRPRVERALARYTANE